MIDPLFSDSDDEYSYHNNEDLPLPSSNLNSPFSPKFTFAEQEDFLAWKNEADQGCVNAQLQTGLCYEKGKGIKQSNQYASHYYKLAADQGSIRAQIYLALLYLDGLGIPQSYTKALRYFKLAANQGSASAQVFLGNLYAEGKGVQKSPKKAVEYYQLAANTGNSIAFANLAEAYEKGWGVEKSQKIANFYYQKRYESLKEEADAGNASSQASVGMCLENGMGIEKSLEEAFHYYQLSARQNDTLGLFLLAQCYAEGKGTQESSGKAIHYYKLAADQGHPLAQAELGKYLVRTQIDEELGVHYLKLIIAHGQCSLALLSSCEKELASCFEKGNGIKQSNQNALHYYKLAAQHGNEIAQNKLGDIYLNGELGAEESAKLAVHYYKLAAQQGYSYSIAMLGQCYENGTGVEQSPSTAFECYKQAAEIDIARGNSSLILDFARCYKEGIGVEKSLETAIHYYKLASENNSRWGYYQAGCCYKEIEGEEAVKQMIIYFKLAAKENNFLAQFELARAYEKGIGVEKSEENALKYFHLAADQGWWPAYLALFDHYDKARNYKKAVKYLHLAAELGDAEALCRLGDYYGKGTHVDQSLEKALYYYRLSFEKGYEDAKLPMETCENLLNHVERSTSLFDPRAQNLNIESYLETHDLSVLKLIFEKSKTIPIIFEAPPLSNAELEVVRDGMITNPQLTLICSVEDKKNLMKSFQHAGYVPRFSLWCQKLDKDIYHKECYGLRFMGLKNAA